MKYSKHSILSILACALLFMGYAGCSNTNNTQKGAVIGGAAGAVLGGVLGNTQDETGKGAIIGAAVGGAAGAIIGHQMDKQAEELESELDDAVVERVGEGIQITFDSAILFDVNSSALRYASKEDLGALGQSLLEYENTDILIIGHTDNTGSEEYNQTLSEKRAAAAAEEILKTGVDPTRVGIMGKGELAPIATNDSVEGRQQNRRVEVAIVANEEYRQELEAQEGQ